MNRFSILIPKVTSREGYYEQLSTTGTLLPFTFLLKMPLTTFANLTPVMSKNSKRPRLQTTTASDIAPQATRHQFTHSSNTSTWTRQIVTTATWEPSEPTKMDSSLNEIDLDSFIPPAFDDFPVTGELEPPAGLEVLTKT